MIQGAWVFSAEYIMHGKGPAIKFAAAKHVNRQIWISDAARAKHAEIVAIIEEVAHRTTGSKWTILICDAPKFIERYQKAVKQHKNYNVIGLVTSKEKKKDRHRDRLSQIL